MGRQAAAATPLECGSVLPLSRRLATRVAVGGAEPASCSLSRSLAAAGAEESILVVPPVIDSPAWERWPGESGGAPPHSKGLVGCTAALLRLRPLHCPLLG